jgi:hypothetical protein
MENHLNTEIVVDAPQKWPCGGESPPLAWCITRTRECTVQVALFFGERLKEVGIKPSMGKTGTALDNAMAERASFRR